MIYERDVDAAIAENMAQSDPNAWTCMRLAALITIKQYLSGNAGQALPGATDYAAILRGVSMAQAPQTPAEEIVEYTSGTEFGKEIDGKRAADIWPIIDELMSILQTMYPPIYQAVMRKIK